MAKQEIYEILYVLSPVLTDEEISEVHQHMISTIQATGGQVRREDKWGKRRLAYEVNKFYEGFYIFVEFDGTGRTVKELNDVIRLERRIIRHLITHVPKAKLDEEKRQAQAAAKAADEAKRKAEAAAAEAQKAKVAEAAPPGFETRLDVSASESVQQPEVWDKKTSSSEPVEVLTSPVSEPERVDSPLEEVIVPEDESSESKGD